MQVMVHAAAGNKEAASVKAQRGGNKRRRYAKRIGRVWGAGILTLSILAFFGCERTWLTEDFFEKTEEERRAILHRFVHTRYLHDAAGMLMSIGDETSVQYLIEALEQFHHVEDDSEGIICSQMRCLDAIRFLTSQDVGPNHGEWKTWWESNKDKTREQWVADGFRAKGLPVVTPPDGAYVRALIREMSPERIEDSGSGWILTGGVFRYNTANARKALESVSRDLLQSQIDLCLKSDDSLERLGAEETLSLVKNTKDGRNLKGPNKQR